AGAAHGIMSPTALGRLGTSFGSNPVCVGPFMFDDRVAGDHVTVIKSPYYYNQGAVHVDKIIFKPMPDLTVAAAALAAGDLQVLFPVDSTALPGVRRNSSLNVLEAKTIGSYRLFINIGNRNGAANPPYTNVGSPLATSPNLRKAFEEAIDRDALV